MHLKKTILSTLLATGLLTAQNSVSININNEDVELQASLNFNDVIGYADGTTYTLNTNYLHADGDNLFGIGLSGENQLQGVYGLTVGLGIKTVFADEFAAVPLLVRGAYILPFTDAIPTTTMEMSFAYAPEVLSFNEAETYSEFRTQLNMEVVSNIHIFAGYRNIDTDYKAFDHTFNDSFYGGLKLNF